MGTRIFTVILMVALVFTVALLAGPLGRIHLPGNQQGYEPPQPINFSHRLHAGEMQIACLYCHSGAQSSRHAGIPAASVCMNCHRVVTAPIGVVRAEDAQAEKEKRAPRKIVSPEIQKIYNALALNNQMQPDSTRQPQPIQWTKVHSLPDFVYFDHRPHVAAGVDCQSCHGAVENMERVKQTGDLSMGWCVNCHRDANRTGVAGKAVKAPVDCSACHY